MGKRGWLALFIILLLAVGGVTTYFMRLKRRTYSIDGYDPDLFGIHETLAYISLEENLDISRAFDIMQSLGVQKLRMQIWRKKFMDWTNNSIVIKNRSAVEQVIQEATSHGIEIMGYAEDFPNWMTNISGDPHAVPPRNMTEGSKYRQFLEVYEESWVTLAREFPEIKVWEIGNEYNLYQFLRPQSGDLDTQERVDIVTDLLYYGSRGIKAGNPNATTVMGGLGPFEESTYGNGIYDIRDFLNSTYENIKSGGWPSTNPDDFFQVVSWHPYTFREKPTRENWVKPNKDVYEVMKKHGDGDKRVIFSEIGYSDNVESRHYAPREKIAEYLREVFKLAKDNFPWLDTIYWFRLIDRKGDGCGIVESPETWTWKPVAYAYQSLIRVEAGFHYVNTLWAGYAFYATLDPRANDSKKVYNDDNCLAARLLLTMDRKVDKAQKVMEWLSGYECDRWKLLLGEDPQNSAILAEYSDSSYADQRALLGIYHSYDRNITLAISELNWIKERFDGVKIVDEVWIRHSYYEPYKLALASILVHRLNDHEFRDKLLQRLLALQILNPPADRGFNYGGFPGTLKPSEDPNNLIPNLETTILSIYALSIIGVR